MPDAAPAELLAPETLARIDNFAFLARSVVEGFLSGLHRSVYHGFGSEFFQYRGYVPGEDLKYLDWKVYAKRDKLYAKVYREETNMNCCFLVDASASMGYRGSRAACTKLRYAAMVAACLAYLAARQGDKVGLFAFRDTLVTALPPAQRSEQLQRLFVELARLTPAGRAEPARALPPVAETLTRRGLVVILSDFLETEEALGALLKRFRFARQDCLVFQILDPDELDFPFVGTAEFQDSESGERVTTAPERVRAAYRQAMAGAVEQVRVACLQEQSDYQLLQTHDNLGHMLAAYLHCREGMRTC